jgi:hypothetical protein
VTATASIIVQGSIIGTGSGTRVVGPITMTSAASNGQVQQIVLQAGTNTITVPTVPATSGCVIILNPANTSIVTLKGVAGDTGIALGKITKQVLNWDSTAPPANFVLSSVATQTGLITEITFF